MCDVGFKKFDVLIGNILCCVFGNVILFYSGIFFEDIFFDYLEFYYILIIFECFGMLE